jgi:antitoxin component YwqK of YwqJK toxin-antitoxin module
VAAPHPDGPYRDYWSDGVLACDGQYRDGVQDGVWRFYDRDGTPREVIRFSGGHEVPPWTDPPIREEGADA